MVGMLDIISNGGHLLCSGVSKDSYLAEQRHTCKQGRQHLQPIQARQGSIVIFPGIQLAPAELHLICHYVSGQALCFTADKDLIQHLRHNIAQKHVQ
ncbi:MAG: hypothetical protein CL912_31790 [Deltaproteobacteria bacterium]|nr:hypothetical protein [Deltaproteobacteria bacterium]